MDDLFVALPRFQLSLVLLVSQAMQAKSVHERSVDMFDTFLRGHQEPG